jgi:hypothetical protein
MAAAAARNVVFIVISCLCVAAVTVTVDARRMGVARRDIQLILWLVLIGNPDRFDLGSNSVG